MEDNVLPRVEICPLCLQPAEKLELTTCGHIYCAKCLWTHILTFNECLCGRAQSIGQLQWVYPNGSSDECPLCLESTYENPVATVCGHLFCGECLLAALREKEECPICRQKMDNRHINYVN